MRQKYHLLKYILKLAQKDLTSLIVLTIIGVIEGIVMTGKDIKELRKKRKLTQQQLADKLGVHQVTVAEWEAGRKKPSNLALRQLNRLVVNNGH